MSKSKLNTASSLVAGVSRAGVAGAVQSRGDVRQARGLGGKSSRARFGGGLRLGLMVSSAAVLLSLIGTQSVRAAPLGGTVAGGSAVISSVGSATTVVQSSDRAVIDWQSFNLAANESVEFQVPAATSATMNRILTGGASDIRGSVSSNGVVFFSNPNGLVFDATSRVAANGFVATTGTLSAFDFMSGSASLSNIGSASSSAISLNGAVAAPSIAVLAGSVTVAGALRADSLTGVGGRIQVTAAGSVSLGQGAVISANGASGGGMISVGGDLHGAGATPNAQFVTVSSGAVISADAVTRGDGGTVAVWADQTTGFSGSITARGGSAAGNGGFVETSGKGLLNFSGLVDTTAAHGVMGTLLLDPTNIEIKTTGDGVTPVANSSDATIAAANNGTQTATGNLAGVTDANRWSILKVADLQTALNANNVIVDAGAGSQNGGGHIKVTNAVVWTSSNSLTLKASNTTGTNGVHGKITINNSLTGGAGAKFIALAQAGIDVAAGVTIDMGTTGTVDLYGRTGSSETAATSSVNLQGTAMVGGGVKIIGATVSMVAGTGGVTIANTTITGNLQLGHATGGTNPAAVGNVVGGLTFTGSNRVTGNLVLGVAGAGTDVDNFLLASGNSLTVDGNITSPNLSGFYSVTGSLTVGVLGTAGTGNVTLTGFGTNIYTPTSDIGVRGDIALNSFDKVSVGTTTNSLTVGNVTTAAGKTLTLTVDSALNSSGSSSVGRLFLGNLTGGSAASTLTINLYSTAPDLQGSLVQNASTAIKVFGTLALNRGGNSLADLSSSTNELATVQLNSGTLQELGALKLTSATSVTLTKINRDKAGADTATNAALTNGAYLGNVTIKTIGANSDITISNTRVSTDKAGALYISDSNYTLLIESGRDIIVTDTGNLSTAGSVTLRAGRDIDFQSSSAAQQAKLNFNGAATARFTAGDTGGIKIGANVEFTATTTDAIDFVLTAGYIDAKGVFAARNISGEVKATTNGADNTHATAYFKKLKGIGGSVNVTFTDFKVLSGNLKVEGMDGAGILHIGAEVTAPTQPDLSKGLVVNGAASGGLGSVNEFDIDIKTDLATLKVNGLLKGSKANLRAASVVSDNGGLQVVNALTMTGTSISGQISLSRIDSSKTKIKSVTAANNMSLSYDSAVTLDGLSVVMQNTPSNRIMKITTTTGTIDFASGVATGLTLDGDSGSVLTLEGRDGVTFSALSNIQYVGSNAKISFNIVSPTNEFNLANPNLDWTRVDTVSVGSGGGTGTMHLLFEQGAAAINLGTGGLANFTALFNSIHPGNSVVFQLLQKTQVRLHTTGAITVNDFNATQDTVLVTLGFYKLDGGSIALNGTSNKFNALSLKATGAIAQAANSRLDLVVGSRLDIDHDNNPGLGTATNLSLEIGAVNSTGVAAIAEDEGVIIGNVSSYGTVGLKFVGGNVPVNGAVAAHSSAVTTIMGTVSSKTSILLSSDAGTGSINKIIFDSGIRTRVGGQLYLNIVDDGATTRGTDITIESDKVQLNSRVFSSGKLTLKTHDYNNVAGGTTSATESFVWKTSDSDLILPKKNSVTANGWLADYTVTKDTGDKTVANTPWNLVFDTGNGKTRFFKTWSTGIGATEVIVTATDFANAATKTTIANTYSVAETAIKQLSDYHISGSGSGDPFSTIQAELDWFSSTPSLYNNNQSAVILHNLGDVGLAAMNDLVDFKSVRVVGNLSKSGDIAFNILDGVFKQDSGSVITANKLSITATGYIDLTGGTNLITAFGVISAGSAVGQANGTAVGITNGKAIDLTDSLIGNGGSVVLKTTVGGISQASGKTISTNLLSLDTVGAVSLASSNSLSSLKLISAGGAVSVANGKALNLVGGVNAGSNTLSLTTTVGGITQDVNSAITAGTLTLSSAGVVTLGASNMVTGLTVSGGGTISFKNGKALNLLGVIGAGTNSLSLTTTVGGITQDAASVVTAGTLSVTSAGVVTLSGTNQVTGFSLVNADGAVELKNGKALNLLDGVNAGANNVTLTTTVGAISQSNSMGNTDSITAGTLTLVSAAAVTLGSTNGVASLTITSAGGDVAFTNRTALTLKGLVNVGVSNLRLRVIANTVTQDAASVITASNLTVESTGAVTLGNTNQVDSLTISNGNSNANVNVTFTNGKALELKGAVTVGTGTLTLKTTAGAFTQAAGGVVTAGILSLDSAGAITVGQTNQISSLTVVAAGGNVTVSNDRALNLKGTVNAGTNDLSLTTTALGITQDADSVITANHASFTSAAGINLIGNNKITTLNSLSGTGNLALTNAQALELNTHLVSGGGNNTITLTVSKDNLKLIKDGMSSDGDLTLMLSGQYDSNGKTWALGSKSLSGSIGGFTAALGDTVFTGLAVGGLSSGLQVSASSDRTFDKTGTKTIVFSSVFAKYGRYNKGTNTKFTEYEESLKATFGDSIELHDISDLSAQSASGLGVAPVDPNAMPQVLTNVNIVKAQGMPDEVTAFTLYNATGTVSGSYKVKTVNFYGTTNIDRLDLSGGLKHDVTLNFKSGSIVTILDGLNLGTNPGTILMEGSDSLRVKRIDAGDKLTVTNNSGSLMNLTDTVITVTAGGLGVSSQGNGIILNNRANSIVGPVNGTTNSGSLQIAGAETITDLNLGLGSLGILSNTSVTVTNLTAGFVRYQVAGKAVISGSFIGVSGSAQNARISSNSTTLVVGNTKADQSIDISANEIVLTGNIVSVGGGSVSVGKGGGTVEVTRDSEISSQNGVINLLSAINSQVNAGLVVNSGYNGTVNLGGNIGTKSLNSSAKTSSSLKWFEVDAGFVNATNISVRTIGAAAAQTTPGLVGYIRPGEVIWNVGTTNGTVGIDTTGGGLTQFSGAKSVRNPTGGLKLN